MGGGKLGGRYGDKPVPKSQKKLKGNPGDVNVTTEYGYKQETLIGKDGRATVERHHADHHGPEVHSNPHDHKITWGKNGNPQYGKAINYRDGEKIPKLQEVTT